MGDRAQPILYIMTVLRVGPRSARARSAQCARVVFEKKTAQNARAVKIAKYGRNSFYKIHSARTSFYTTHSGRIRAVRAQSAQCAHAVRRRPTARTAHCAVPP